LKRSLTVIGVLVVGIILGFILGQNIAPIQKLKIVKEQIIDTVFKSKIVEVPIETTVQTVDTVYISANNDSVQKTDDIAVDTLALDDEDEDTLQIVKDEKIKTESLKINVIKAEVVDTLLQKLLDVEKPVVKQILVEYWESPINYKGYKLSRSKLIIYGIKPLVTSVLYKNEQAYYLKANNIFYELYETTDFKSLVSVPKPEVIHD
jgi:hypothetical protein